MPAPLAVPSPPGGPLLVRVARVLFHDAKTGYTVLRARKGDEELTVTGTWPSPRLDVDVECDGAWGNHPKFGLQFQAGSIVERLPSDTDGIRAYLASGVLPGIGEKAAGELVKRFGQNVFKVLEETPDALLEVPGIGEKTLAKVKAGWVKARAVHRVMVFLRQIGLGPQLACRVHRELSDEGQKDVVGLIQSNPYLLATVPGIGFVTADQAALKMGILRESRFRVMAGIVHVLEDRMGRGHTVCSGPVLVEAASNLLGVDPDLTGRTLEEMLLLRDSVVPTTADGAEVVALKTCWLAEKTLAREIARLMPLGRPEMVPRGEIEALARGAAFKLSASQLDALQAILSTTLAVLTGGPGMGKTTITKFVLDRWEALGLKLALCAPTGRAAKQLSEATGREAKTIHRLLGIDGSGQAVFSEEHRMEVDALVVDESSMLDIFLAGRLLKALKNGTRVLFVGDVDQLPSVGAGNVLGDLIESELVAVARLTEVFRQAKGSGIALGAQQIIRGAMPASVSDFLLLEEDDTTRIAERIVAGVARLAQSGVPEKDIQVLSPMRKGPIGTESLNLQLHEALNPRRPGEPVVQIGQVEFRLRTRIMQLKNNYDLEIYNGDQGFVIGIDEEEKTVRVDFDGHEVSLGLEDLFEVALSYAVTVHKSQGGQFRVVIMPVHTAHFVMLNRNLVYTGVTRAREQVYVLGTQRALKMAVKREANLARETGLKDRLIELARRS